MSQSSAEAFTTDAEDLARRADEWDPSAHSPRESVNLIAELTRALRTERGGRATRAEMIKQSNIAYGQLEEAHKAACRYSDSLEVQVSSLNRQVAELQLRIAARGWLSRLAARIEDGMRSLLRLGP